METPPDAQSQIIVRHQQHGGGSVSRVLLGLLTGAGALFLIAVAGYLATERFRMRSWERVPMLIESAWVSDKDTSSFSHMGPIAQTLSRARARYSYDYNGQSYIGGRATISALSDSFSSFHRQTVRTLRKHERSQEPFLGFVNPNLPAESVLFLTVPASTVGFITALALCFFLTAFSEFAGLVRRPAAQPFVKKVRRALFVLFLAPLFYLGFQAISDGNFFSYLPWQLASVVAAYFFLKK